MRIALTSDTHLFIDKCVNEKRFKRLIKRMLADGYDIGVHAGDWSGGKFAWRCIEIQCQIIRELDPDRPWVVTTGNHDLWVRGRWTSRGLRGAHQRPNLVEWLENRAKISEIFKRYNMHFIDEAPFRDPRFKDWVIVGAMGWYVSDDPPTNDYLYLPHMIEGQTANSFLLSESHKKLYDNFSDVQPEEKLIFLSHFPVIEARRGHPGYKGGDHDSWNWSRSIGDFVQREFDCRHFLCGHSHARHEGPLRYEAGSGAYEVSQGAGDLQHLIVDFSRSDQDEPSQE